MNLSGLVASISDFSDWKHVEKIKLFAWYLHDLKRKELLFPRDIGACYHEVHSEPPANITSQLNALEKKRPRQFLRRGKGYLLEGRERESFRARFGKRDVSLQIEVTLENLPQQLASPYQRVFLEETLRCLRANATRAAVVMAWNLAYDHLCNLILAENSLTEFNSAWKDIFPGQHRKKPKKVEVRDNLLELLKEGEVIDICQASGLVSKNQKKILHENLGRRNRAAHPALEVVTQVQAEAVIDELVRNIILKLEL